MATTLTHKVRNPKNLETWLNIWTANITDDQNYTITPSEKWNIPSARLTGNLPNTIEIPVNQIVDTTTVHNVTTPKTPSATNALTKFDSSGNLVAGPTLSATGAVNGFLNEKGDWITINATGGITFDDPTNTHQITLRHENSTTGKTIGDGQNSSGTEILYIPYFTYNNFGHITTAGTFKHTINNLGNNNIAENAAISPSKIDNLPNYITETVTDSDNTNILNTKTNNGIVKAGNNNTNKIWATDNEGNPDWGKVTADHMNLADGSISGEILEKESVPSNTFDTRLLGAFISENEPTLIQNWETAEYNLYSDVPIIKTHIYDFYGISSDSAASLQFKLQIQEKIVTEEGQRKIIFNTAIRLPANSTVRQDYLKLELPYPNNIAFLSMDGVFNEALSLYNNELQRTQSYAQMVSSDGALGHICLAIKNRLIAYYNSNSSSTYAKPDGLATISYSKIMSELNPWDYDHCGIWIEI